MIHQKASSRKSPKDMEHRPLRSKIASWGLKSPNLRCVNRTSEEKSRLVNGVVVVVVVIVWNQGHLCTGNYYFQKLSGEEETEDENLKPKSATMSSLFFLFPDDLRKNSKKNHRLAAETSQHKSLLEALLEGQQPLSVLWLGEKVCKTDNCRI